MKVKICTYYVFWLSRTKYFLILTTEIKLMYKQIFHVCNGQHFCCKNLTYWFSYKSPNGFKGTFWSIIIKTRDRYEC